MENNGELYCLKWNQFQINIFSALENLHLTEDFADVTLYCDGTSHKAHKVILSACSPYFKSVFMEHPLCSHPVIILKGVSYEDLVSLLTFMYQGEVNIQRERLPEFMRTAKLLQIRGLANCYEINPVFQTSSNQQKRQLQEDSNTDSDSSTHGKKKIRIRRKSATKSSNENVSEITDLKSTSNVVADHVDSELTSVQSNPKNDENSKFDTSSTHESAYSDVSGIKIKQEFSDNEHFETQSMSSEYDNEGSILQRSLIGDHTVKPAESLVITPDLPPLSNINPLSTPALKVETEESKALPNNLPTQTNPMPHIFQPKAVVHRKNPDLKEKQETDVDNFEDKLSNTLQLLKSNPQISVSREHLDNINKKDFYKSGNAKQKSGQFEIQPQISIEPMKQSPSDNGEKHHRSSSFSSTSSNNTSILAQNLTKVLSNSKPTYSTTPRNISIDRNSATQTTSKLSSESISQPESQHSSLSTLVQLFGHTHGVSGNTSQSSAGQSWNCPHCQQLYHNQSALKYHVRLVHSDFNNRLCCYLCPNSFTMRESYKAHMLELHGIRH